MKKIIKHVDDYNDHSDTCTHFPKYNDNSNDGYNNKSETSTKLPKSNTNHNDKSDASTSSQKNSKVMMGITVILIQVTINQ